jgi:DNA-binding response OmpR family regulator
MPPQDSKKILLVEDEELIRELYTRQLTKAGFTVNAVGTGEDGLKTLGEQAYDLLLLDVMLPGINGLQVLREFKVKNPTSKMYVIMLTNLGQESVIKEGFDLGANAYLIKTSYSPDQIIQEVRNVLDGKPTNLPTS